MNSRSKQWLEWFRSRLRSAALFAALLLVSVLMTSCLVLAGAQLPNQPFNIHSWTLLPSDERRAAITLAATALISFASFLATLFQIFLSKEGRESTKRLLQQMQATERQISREIGNDGDATRQAIIATKEAIVAASEAGVAHIESLLAELRANANNEHAIAELRVLLSASIPEITTAPTDAVVGLVNEFLTVTRLKAGPTISALLVDLQSREADDRSRALRAIQHLIWQFNFANIMRERFDISVDNVKGLNVAELITVVEGSMVRRNIASVVESLAVCLRDPEISNRFEAVKALTSIGPMAAAAVPALSICLDGDVAGLRGEAARALSEVGSIKGVDALLRAISGDPNPPPFILDAIAAVKSDDSGLVEFLKVRLNDERPPVVSAINHALANKTPPVKKLKNLYGVNHDYSQNHVVNLP